MSFEPIIWNRVISGVFTAKVDIEANPDVLAKKDYEWAESEGFAIQPIYIGDKVTLDFAPGVQSMLMARLLAPSAAGRLSIREHKKLDSDPKVQKFFQYVPAAKVIYEIIGPVGEAIRKAFQPRETTEITVLQPFSKTDADMLAKVGLPKFGPSGFFFIDERGGFFERKEIVRIAFPIAPFDPAKTLAYRLNPGKPVPDGVWFKAPKTDSDTPRTASGVDKVGGPPPVPTGKPGSKPLDPSVAARAAGEAAGRAMADPAKRTAQGGGGGGLLLLGGAALVGLLLMKGKR